MNELSDSAHVSGYVHAIQGRYTRVTSFTIALPNDNAHCWHYTIHNVLKRKGNNYAADGAGSSAPDQVKRQLMR